MRLLKKNYGIGLSLMVFLVFFFSACSDCGDGKSSASGDPSGGDPLSVAVVNYPLQYFAERIGGDAVTVVFPAPGDEDPAYWVPDAEAISAYQEADLILANGATYAKWLDKVSLPLSKLVDTSKDFQDRYIALDHAVTHSHGAEGEHEHRGWAFTTWLDPRLAIAHARSVMEALVAARPAMEEGFRKAFGELEADLTDLDEAIAAAVSGGDSVPLIMSHPVYQYLVRRYSLNARSVHWEPDAAPDPAMWQKLSELRASHPATWMIWEGPPLDEVRSKLVEKGIESVLFDPCGNVPAEGDFLSVMKQNAENLARVAAK